MFALLEASQLANLINTALLSLRFCTFCFFYFLTNFDNSPELNLSEIANAKKDSKTFVKLMSLSFMRLQKHQNIQYRTGFVSFFDIVDFHKIDLLSAASN